MNSNRRTTLNVLTFMALSTFLVWFGANNFLLTQADGPRLFAEFVDASGLQARNDVTMRGVPVGQVGEVRLTDENYVNVEIKFDPGVEVPEGTEAEIVRRSSIGELTLELHPGDGPALDNGAVLDVELTIPPPDISKTIEVMADVLHAVPSGDLTTLVHELATGVAGRAEDLADLSEAGADLPERLLQIESQLEALITTGPEVTGVFADNADVLADDITQTAELVDILRDNRYELVSLTRNGARFLTVGNDLLATDKANISCLLADFADINTEMAAGRDDLAELLDKNHYFFDAVELSVQTSLKGANWFRVQMLPHQEPAGRSYEPHRDPPDVFPGRACTSRYGLGVRASQGRTKLAPESQLYP